MNVINVQVLHSNVNSMQRVLVAIVLYISCTVESPRMIKQSRLNVDAEEEQG